ncbi:unnamed protein product, partial [Ilex paraguariensis]
SATPSNTAAGDTIPVDTHKSTHSTLSPSLIGAVIRRRQWKAVKPVFSSSPVQTTHRHRHNQQLLNLALELSSPDAQAFDLGLSFLLLPKEIDSAFDVLKEILKPVVDGEKEIPWPPRDPEAVILTKKDDASLPTPKSKDHVSLLKE